MHALGAHRPTQNRTELFQYLYLFLQAWSNWRCHKTLRRHILTTGIAYLIVLKPRCFMIDTQSLINRHNLVWIFLALFNLHRKSAPGRWWNLITRRIRVVLCCLCVSSSLVTPSLPQLSVWQWQRPNKCNESYVGHQNIKFTVGLDNWH